MSKKKPLIPAGDLKGFGLDAREALKWFAEKEQDVRKKERQVAFHSRPNIGEMYTFSYDPKLKATLPYYDRSPLIFPVNYYSDGLLGMNLHYLPPGMRKKLFDALMKYTAGRDGRQKLKISYSIISSASKSNIFSPTIKRYLYSHVQTKFARVPSDEWREAIMLPMARFTKASAGKVWADSRRMIQ